MHVALMAGTGAAAITAGGAYWTHHRRLGSGFVNSMVNPWLLNHRLAGGRHSEIAPLEHIGRTSGIRRLTPVHPEPTVDGFRVMLPLGAESQWARNVLAAGRCRLQLHGRIYGLADPRLVRPREVTELPRVIRAVTDLLGFRYLILKTVATEPGDLE